MCKVSGTSVRGWASSVSLCGDTGPARPVCSAPAWCGHTQEAVVFFRVFVSLEFHFVRGRAECIQGVSERRRLPGSGSTGSEGRAGPIAKPLNLRTVGSRHARLGCRRTRSGFELPVGRGGLQPPAIQRPHRGRNDVVGTGWRGRGLTGQSLSSSFDSSRAPSSGVWKSHGGRGKVVLTLCSAFTLFLGPR